jgi:hypothetical protein
MSSAKAATKGRIMKNNNFKQTIGADLLVNSIKLTNVKHKLQLPKDQEGEGWSKEMTEDAEREYKRFLTLIKIYPDTVFVPNKLMDEMWHRHILDTAAYEKDCKEVFGCFLHHYPYYGLNGPEDKSNLDKDFLKTKVLYALQFGEEMDREALAVRCGSDHACHAETSCACRVSTACN